MIDKVIDLLKSKDWTNTGSDFIEIAKGKNELATTFKVGKEQIKRVLKTKKVKE